MKKLILLILLLGVLTGCADSADYEEERTVDKQQLHYIRTQPSPWFEWSLERYLMTELYKSRNDAVSTFSYVWDGFRGKISWRCASIGYPIPGGTQLTNPEKREYDTTIAQAEPNGLFSPDSSQGTYIMCLNPDESGTVGPVYQEPAVSTFPYPMQEVNGELVPVPGTTSSIAIDPSAQPAPDPAPTTAP